MSLETDPMLPKSCAHEDAAAPLPAVEQSEKIVQAHDTCTVAMLVVKEIVLRDFHS